MIKVVDSNYLQSDLLRDYLSNSSNKIVIPDSVSIEAHAGDICKSMKVLCRNHQQVIILKRTEKILKLSMDESTYKEKLIDLNQTSDFKNFCHLLYAGENGNTKEQINKYRRESKAERDRTERESLNIAPQISSMFSKLKKQEKQILKSSDYPYEDDSMKNKISIDVGIHVGNMYSSYSNTKEIPNEINLKWSYLYRNSVCTYFFALQRYLDGGLDKIHPRKIRNDIVDMQIMSYATYFNGILSMDKRAIKIFNQASKYILHDIKPNRVAEGI